MLELPLEEVAGRQAAEGLRQIDGGGGPQFGERHATRVVLHGGSHRPDRLHERDRIRHADTAGPAHGDRLEVLRAHHGADAAAARGAVLVVHDAGEAHQLLAARTDARHPQARNPQLPPQPVLGVADRTAPVVLRIAQFDVVVVDVEEDRLGRPPFDDHHVVAREPQLGAPVAARIRRRDGVGQRAFGHHHVAGAAGHRRAGQRPGGKDQLVRGRQRVHLRVELFIEIAGGQTAPAEIVAQPIGPYVLDRDPAVGQVHSQQLAHGCLHRSLLSRCLARAGNPGRLAASCRERRRGCDELSRPRPRTTALPAATRRTRSPAWGMRWRTPAARRTGCTSRPCRTTAA